MVGRLWQCRSDDGGDGDGGDDGDGGGDGDADDGGDDGGDGGNGDAGGGGDDGDDDGGGDDGATMVMVVSESCLNMDISTLLLLLLFSCQVMSNSVTQWTAVPKTSLSSTISTLHVLLWTIPSRLH